MPPSIRQSGVFMVLLVSFCLFWSLYADFVLGWLSLGFGISENGEAGKHPGL